MKIGLIGCGRISKRHFDVLRELKDYYTLTCVCDIDKEKAKKAGEENNVNYYTDYKTMLKEEDIDIISICTPSGLHPQHGIMAAERGIHIITEKPMAIKLEDADELINVCDKNNVKLFVVKQNRLNPGIVLLKRAIDKKRFGKINMVNATVFWQRPQEYYDMASWRGTWEFDGGAFMNQASHYIDIITWLVGPVDYVMSITGTLGRKIEAEDTGAAVIKFRNGAIGVIQVTMLTYPKNYEGSITVLGSKGSVKIGGTALNKLEKWDFEDKDEDDEKIKSIDYNPPNVYGFGHYMFYKQIIDDIKNNEDSDFTGRSGRKALELTLAIYKSSKYGKKIALPIDYPK